MPSPPSAAQHPFVSGCCNRMKARGDTGLIRRAEENFKQIKHLHAKVDAVMAHLQIPAVASPMEMTDRK